jgi:hypothetical protein
LQSGWSARETGAERPMAIRALRAQDIAHRISRHEERCAVDG